MTVGIDLGLPQDASERDIRRAYAQRLKQIDFATQPDAFQALRKAYEQALARAKRGEVEAPRPDGQHLPVQEPVAPSAISFESVYPEVDQVPADEVQEVLAEFLAKVHASLRSEDDVAQALISALDDARLVQVDAVQRFEVGVALALAQGWQPGHEYLLGSSAARFEWSVDIGRLRRLGQAGAFLNAALLEKQHLFAQKPKVFEGYASLVTRLRDASEPSRRLLIEDMPLLRILIKRYPHWLVMVTSRANVQHWLALYDALPESAKPKASAPREDDSQSQPLRTESPVADSRWVFVWAWIAAIFVIARYLNH